jgi:hypothetical protein
MDPVPLVKHPVKSSESSGVEIVQVVETLSGSGFAKDSGSPDGKS